MRTAGIDIGGTSVKLGVYDGDTLIHKTSFKTPLNDPQALCRAIADALSGQAVQRVGVGTAGSVDFRRDTVCASNLGWTDVPLRRMLEEELRLPVFVDNDAQAALMAEWVDGVCKGADCALYLTLGTGIGGAMIVGGRPYRGAHNLGAEFGHTIIHPHGPLCGCGRRGCLEYYASATGLSRMAGGRSAFHAIEAAKAGNPYCVRAFRRYVHELCIGLNNLIMTFDPQVIALGGGVSGAGDFLENACQRELARVFSKTTDPLLCSVRIARHQNDAGILGASYLAREASASITNFAQITQI